MSYLGSPPQFAQFPSKFFDGDDSAMTVTLDYAPPNNAALLVFISGVRQDTSAYTLSGTSLTFTGTVPSGTANVQVVHLGQLAEIPTPGDDTVSAAKLQSDSVITAKILDDNVTTAKILDNNVTLAKLDDGTQGDVLYYGASGAPARLGFGTDGYFLKTQGTGANPVWAEVATGTAWQSVVTASTLTAVAGNGYPINTTSNDCTVTLPASASVGDTIEFVDYAGTFDTNNVILNPNGLNIKGATDILRIITEREGVTLTYVDATQGWVVTAGSNEGTPALAPNAYSIDFLVVAGGGGCGYGNSGAGGGGGFRTSTQLANAGTAITVTVGDGGAAAANTGVTGGNGSDSSIAGTGLTTITSAGGGGGGSSHPSASADAGDGGSGGGGGSRHAPAAEGAGGSGNTPVTSPVQGYDGGDGDTDAYSWAVGGGGGGASEVGENYVAGTNAGDGGDGAASSITGASVTYAGGGGGGANSASFPSGAGGAGGGGAGSGTGPGTAGTVNTGGGAGGSLAAGVAGGKGIVILSVPTAEYSSTTTGSPTVSTSGLNTIMEFTGTGSYTA